MSIYKELYVITGASKGLGSEIALEVSQNNSIILLISRDENNLTSVAQKCSDKGAVVFTISEDITKETFPDKFKKMLQQILSKKIDTYYLFNNASVIDPINKLVNITRTDQKRVVDINLTSSIWIASEFLRTSKTRKPKETYIVNISSGVSLKPIKGWSLYCISKSGINMLTACIAEETSDWENKVYSVAINPGALDTEMQKIIRESDINESPIAEKFIKMNNDRILNKPDQVAKKMLNMLKEKSFINGKFVDFNLIK